MTPLDIITYYANLLILQYLGQPKAYATVMGVASQTIMPTVSVQTIAFPTIPASGVFQLNYGGLSTGNISWNAAASTIQSDLRALTGLGSVTVSGSIASGLLTVTFTGVIPIADLLTISGNTLADGSSNPVTPQITETDIPLPLVVQNAFAIPTAVGAQLDILAKYVGVSRNTFDFSGPVTLDDADLRTLILVKVIQNNSGSSLSQILGTLYATFGTALRVFDGADMHMDYFFQSTIGSETLAEVFVEQGFLPKPMGVQLGVLVYAPSTTEFFGMPDYNTVSIATWATQAKGFNTYASYDTTNIWLSTANVITP